MKNTHPQLWSTLHYTKHNWQNRNKFHFENLSKILRTIRTS